ncbi:hypothetical protein Pint_20448 [Pistacia integerrima]|uniref:Uncharacterized protein n=2 Tax=Pistacia TaxID=55512 RepID=A0ACC0ZXQ4_9ROSI|nr:hypothetical protein Pint_20448 [Pistacia integerrima]KAJ0078951.1 hypothetical protein Patl1_23221 [Pistacia atlantica]
MGPILSTQSELNPGDRSEFDPVRYILGKFIPVDRSKLNPGDHICSNRMIVAFDHHGIYVGHGMVIHLMPAEKEGGCHQMKLSGLPLSFS